MPILDPNSFEFISRSPDQTRRIGIRLGSMLQAEDVICLSGDLGAGKTTLTQGIAVGWGSLEPATSPTFVLAKNYHRPDGSEMVHLDAYRLENALEAEDLDIDQMAISGPFIVEWPERILAALPENRMWIQMTYLGDEQRGMILTPFGKRYTFILNKIKNDMVKSFL